MYFFIIFPGASYRLLGAVGQIADIRGNHRKSAAVEEAISGARQTSENSEHITLSMEKVSRIAEKVQKVIRDTNN